MDTVQTEWGVDWSTFRLAGHVDRLHSIVLKMKYNNISPCFFQLLSGNVASRCVLQNFDLKS